MKSFGKSALAMVDEHGKVFSQNRIDVLSEDIPDDASEDRVLVLYVNRAHLGSQYVEQISCLLKWRAGKILALLKERLKYSKSNMTWQEFIDSQDWNITKRTADNYIRLFRGLKSEQEAMRLTTIEAYVQIGIVKASDESETEEVTVETESEYETESEDESDGNGVGTKNEPKKLSLDEMPAKLGKILNSLLELAPILKNSPVMSRFKDEDLYSALNNAKAIQERITGVVERLEKLKGKRESKKNAA